jgi:glutamyl-tRNA reductase
MVVGEREILRQLRETYEKNNELGLTQDAIRLAMRFCVEAAKKVYSATKIGEKPVSVVSLSIQKMLEKIFPADARFLLICAGQTPQSGRTPPVLCCQPADN